MEESAVDESMKPMDERVKPDLLIVEPDQGEINDFALARRWGMSRGTLQVWRSLGRGPKYNKRGRKVTYSIADIEQYEMANKINPDNN
jgi:hypothetical protein